MDSLQELEQQRRILQNSSNADRQHAKGKLTADERLAYLFDKDTFIELNVFQNRGQSIEKPPKRDGVIAGFGKINGRFAYAYAQDFTVQGGSLSSSNARKIIKCQQAALKAGAPIIGLMDSGGAKIQDGIQALAQYGTIFQNNVNASGVIPQITAIMGPCAGGASYSPALQDFIFFVEGTGEMFVTGPDVVKEVIGEDISMQELGGADVHMRKNGVAHVRAANDQDCLDKIRTLLTYLPQNNKSLPIPRAKYKSRWQRGIENIVPENKRKIYDVKRVIDYLVDTDSFFEIEPEFAANVVTCFARVNGHTVGVVANQPAVISGCMDVNASCKAARFVRTCDCFNIPLLTLVDVPGFFPGSDQEYSGIIRHGAKVLYAYSEATVPKITLVLRKAYGGAYIAMCCKQLGADVCWAWPTAEIAVMGAEGAVKIINRKDLKAAGDDYKKVLDEKVKAYQDTQLNPFVGAKLGYIDDVIAPQDTRRLLEQTLEALISFQDPKEKPHHGNIPL
ncbi:MAG: acyl-CoA carboxylase subunit beta [Clostridiales bacterium]|nr:acyl-CoA carboxylase subunit beta [Clostridiales bacterium]MCD8008310.1 acyl-CoA carboxylase subunit beta [Clostridiales bacterium]